MEFSFSIFKFISIKSYFISTVLSVTCYFSINWHFRVFFSINCPTIEVVFFITVLLLNCYFLSPVLSVKCYFLWSAVSVVWFSFNNQRYLHVHRTIRGGYTGARPVLWLGPSIVHWTHVYTTIKTSFFKPIEIAKKNQQQYNIA